MATVNGTHSLVGDDDYNAIKVTFEGLSATNRDGAPVDVAEFNDLSFQVTGTFGGATVIMQGSNDGGTTWATLRDDVGNVLAVTSAGLVSLLEPVEKIRPYLSVAGAANDIDVTLFARRVPRGRM